MPCENNRSVICNFTERYYYASYIDKVFSTQHYLALRDVFNSGEFSFKIMPVAYTYDDLYSTMIDFEHELALRYQYKHYWMKQLFDSFSTRFSIDVEPKNLDQYLLCKGLLFMIHFHLISLEFGICL